MRRSGVILALALAMVAITAIFAAAQPQRGKPAFDVISVKPNRSGTFDGTTVGQRGSTFSAINATLKMLIQAAYLPADGGLLPDDRIVGGPSWIGSDHFDVLAKPSGNVASPSRVQIAFMVQSLLEDRFRLKAHQETRDLPVYNLLVGKGLKMKRSDDQTSLTGPTATKYDSSDEPLSRGFLRVSTSPSLVVIAGNAIPLSRLIPVLESRVGRKIIDKTELKGLYDFNARFNATDTAVTAGDQSAASIFTAIEDLGLKLEPAKAPLDVVVVDSVSKPTGN
jgi:uncharacterized protein (TIGR03435 family)